MISLAIMSVAALTAIHPHTIGLKMGSTKNAKKHRLSYSVMFKLAAVCYAETYGNRATARYLGINEKQIRDWRSKKCNLIQSDSSAKRLKGAGRQPNQQRILAKENISHLEFDKKSYGHFDSTGYPQWSFARNIDIKEGFLPYILPNQKTLACEIEHQLGVPFKDQSSSIEGTDFEQEQIMEKELDFHERFSCALALLDLHKAT